MGDGIFLKTMGCEGGPGAGGAGGGCPESLTGGRDRGWRVRLRPPGPGAEIGALTSGPALSTGCQTRPRGV